MRSPPSHNLAARRIVDIQGEVICLRMDAERRERLITEQRTLWESLFPEFSFDQIAATLH